MTNSPTENVLNKITNGDVRMRPRMYFVLQVLAIAALSVVIFVLTSFILSFIFYSIVEGGEHNLLSFGLQGIWLFILIFPWPLLILDIVGLVALRFLLQRFKAVYQASFLTATAVLVTLSIVLAGIVNAAHIHTYLEGHAERDELPFFNGVYKDIRMTDEFRGEFRGTITSITGRVLKIENNDHDHDRDDGEFTVTVKDYIDISTLTVGDEVYIAGEYEDSGIEAYGIVKVK